MKPAHERNQESLPPKKRDLPLNSSGGGDESTSTRCSGSTGSDAPGSGVAGEWMRVQTGLQYSVESSESMAVPIDQYGMLYKVALPSGTYSPNSLHQFWAAYVPCESQYKDAVRQTVEQIDVVHRLCHLYPDDLMFATSSDDILSAFQQNKTASLIGVEGGHSIDSSLGTLRMFYNLGVRYLTLTHSCNTPWADNWLVDTEKDTAINNGLSDFEKELIKEMNRIGMLIDLAHVSEKVMNLALELSKAPVIFSHSSAYEVCNSKCNVPDDVLLKVAQKKGIVMVNFYNDYVTCQKTANLSNVADHFDHIKKVAGHEIIGFGGDYDGVSRVPEGLEDVSKYPDLVAELLRRGWTDVEVKAALGDNLLRVFREVEKVRDSMSSVKPYEVPIPYADVVNPCRTMYGYPPQDNAGSMISLGLHLPVLTLLLHGTIVRLF